MFSAPSILLFDLFGDLAFGLGGLSGARGQLVQVPQLMPLTFCVTLLDVLVESVVESRSAAVFWLGTGKTMRIIHVVPHSWLNFSLNSILELSCRSGFQIFLIFESRFHIFWLQKSTFLHQWPYT